MDDYKKFLTRNQGKETKSPNVSSSALMPLLYNGIPVHVSEHCLDITRHPVRTHRKKRQRKKWLKKFGTWTEEKPGMYVLDSGFGKNIMMHPEIFKLISKSI
jgi:hypothetical protein